ncbi:uncharacterized protein LOC141594001 [Silene latifolia]|uniref:uncharacterized protein LOC141594001 n=1 Tax=Silene latifolia TaxID=37657 RepID=UPI003D783B01
MALPEIICLKSVYNNKYLRYRHENVQTHGLLQFSVDTVLGSTAQFEVVQAQCGDGLVHLKSRYMNRFLVRWSPNHYWITASAEEPNENKGEWSCTLFKPIIIENGGATKKARIMHVQLGHYACLWRIGAPFDSCLFAGSKDTDHDSCDLFSIIDWSSALKLPQNVAFKGDNGKYIGAFSHNGRPCFKFSFDDPNDPKVAQEVFGSRDGTVYIKSKYYGKFWRLDKDDDLIVADVIEPNNIDNHASAMFRVNVIDINSVALLNMSKTWFVKRLSIAHEYVSLLNAANQSVDHYATFEVKDLGK